MQASKSGAIAKFTAPKKKVFQIFPVYLKLPWIGNISLKIQKQIKTAMSNYCRATEF